MRGGQVLQSSFSTVSLGCETISTGNVLMEFKLEYTVRQLMLRSDGSLIFDYGGPHGVKVELRQPSKEEQSKGHRSEHAFCTATSTTQPNERVTEIFANIQADKILPSDSSERAATEYSTPDGIRVRIPALNDFPEHFRSFVNNVSDELRDFAYQTIAVLRWRANELGPHNPISTRGLHWSPDGAFWHPMPANLHVRVETRGTVRTSQEMCNEVAAIVAAGGVAPLHHDLYREAWEQRHSNPRSSIVIGMAASELSVKRCISDLVPEAEWLATNLPAPPLIRMLIEYFPKLPAKCNFDGCVKPPPQPVLDDLKNGVTIRNQLSHAGTSSPSGDTVEPILLAVHDLLWLVDYYMGHDWAIEFLRQETRSALCAA